MTDETNETTDDEPIDDDAVSDVDAALESAGFKDSDGDGDDGEGESAGWLDKFGQMSGTGKSLDNYENDPIAGMFTPDGEDTPRGAKHIARGVDGLSPFAAAHPAIDIVVGFVLLRAEGRLQAEGGKSATDAPGDDGDDSHYRGDMT